MDKPFLSIPEQRELLRSRGLALTSDAETDRLLFDKNYYRISGYARQYQVDPRNGRDDFAEGSSLARVSDMIRLDDVLRRVLFEALTEIEVTVRSRFAHEAGRVSGAHAFYLEPESYLSITPRLDDHLAKLESELRRPAVAVTRYRVGDDLMAVPIWVAVEVMSFGMLARMVQYFDDPSAAKATAASLSLPWLGFQSTIHAFAVLRNACAHHAQLWHRPSGIAAAPAKKDRRNEPKYDANGRSVYATIIARKRYTTAIDRDSTFSRRVDEVLSSDSEYAQGIFFPQPR